MATPILTAITTAGGGWGGGGGGGGGKRPLPPPPAKKKRERRKGKGQRRAKREHKFKCGLFLMRIEWFTNGVKLHNFLGFSSRFSKLYFLCVCWKMTNLQSGRKYAYLEAYNARARGTAGFGVSSAPPLIWNSILKRREKESQCHKIVR